MPIGQQAWNKVSDIRRDAIIMAYVMGTPIKCLPCSERFLYRLLRERGVGYRQRVLMPDDAVAIRESKLSARQLAKQYRISRDTVAKIRKSR